MARLPMMLAACLLLPVLGKVIDFEAAGATADDDALDVERRNGALLNASLAALEAGDRLVIPNKTFHVMGGIVASGLRDVTVQLDGTLKFSTRMDAWPRSGDGTKAPVLACTYWNSPRNVTFTSSGTGTLDGQGATWWGFPGVGYLERGENRPRLFHVDGARDVLVERVHFVNSPFWTFWVDGADGLEVRHCAIDARRSATATTHSAYELTAFNTDGFDFGGSRNVWVHDSSVWCQDDAIAVKDGCENMLFERIEASGLGLTIGSIGGTKVRNVTFRDVGSEKPVKGIYLKFRSDGGTVEDVTYENVRLQSPEQWPIWIGPAQQSDSTNLCAAHPCSLCWPTDPWATCAAPVAEYRNILLKNVSVDSPKNSVGVLLANASSPMVNITFEDVFVTNPNAHGHWGEKQFYCDGVASGYATGRTNVVPPCFTDLTDRARH